MESLIQYGDYCLKILFHQEYSKTSLLGFFLTKNKQSRNFKFLTQGKVAFNLEISQNGSYLYMYVPHGILNWVWVKWNYDIEILCNWLHQTDFSSFTILSSPSLCFSVSWTNFFFSSVWCFFILCQKRIFRVNDTKTWLRLNTTRPNPFGKNQPWRLDVCVTDVNFYLLKKLLFCLKHQEMFFTPNNQEINQFQICSGHWIESLKTHLYRVSCTQVFFLTGMCQYNYLL